MRDPLMDGGQAADDDVVRNADMAGERRVVHEDDVVADVAVEGDMGAHHDEAPRPHLVTIAPPAVPGFIVTCSRTTVVVHRSRAGSPRRGISGPAVRVEARETGRR